MLSFFSEKTLFFTIINIRTMGFFLPFEYLGLILQRITH